MKHELHILVGCADARDLSQVQIDAVQAVSQVFAAAGTKIHFRVIRAAGSFISADVYADIRHLVLDFQKEHGPEPADTSIYVHIQSHGHLEPDFSGEYLRGVHELRIVEGSPLNCGMLGAAGVGVEIESLIEKEQLSYVVAGQAFRIGENATIRDLLRDVYAHDGYLAGDWVHSIDLLRAHPRTQKAKLEHAMSQDPDIKRFRFGVTAGIQDYHRHGLVRVDKGVPAVPFWDEVQQRVRREAAAHLPELHRQAERQKPLAGLICMADPRSTSRMDAAIFYTRYRNLDAGEGYLPNTIFNMTGSTFDIPGTPFGPYVITGFYYAVKHLGLTDQMVMGNTREQTERILLKIKYDPIMDLIVRHFAVNLIPINQRDL